MTSKDKKSKSMVVSSPNENSSPKGTEAIVRASDRESSQVGFHNHTEESVTASLLIAKKIAKEVAASSLGGHRTENDALTAILMGQDLGLPPTVALNNIYSIEGRGSMGIHVMSALCRKGNVRVEVLEDCLPVYGVYIKGEKGAELSRIASLAELKEFTIQGEKPSPKPVDYRTRIKLTRKLKDIDGSYYTETYVSDFLFSTAVNAGLHTKANWKYKDTMMMNRALSKGYRFIAADIIFNMQELGEMVDSFDVPYNVTPQGEVEIINTDGTKVQPINEELVSTLEDEATVKEHETPLESEVASATS